MKFILKEILPRTGTVTMEKEFELEDSLFASLDEENTIAKASQLIKKQVKIAPFCYSKVEIVKTPSP